MVYVKIAYSAVVLCLQQLCLEENYVINSIQYDLFKQHLTKVQFKTIQTCYTGNVVWREYTRS